MAAVVIAGDPDGWRTVGWLARVSVATAAAGHLLYVRGGGQRASLERQRIAAAVKRDRAKLAAAEAAALPDPPVGGKAPEHQPELVEVTDWAMADRMFATSVDGDGAVRKR